MANSKTGETRRDFRKREDSVKKRGRNNGETWTTLDIQNSGEEKSHMSE